MQRQGLSAEDAAEYRSRSAEARTGQTYPVPQSPLPEHHSSPQRSRAYTRSEPHATSSQSQSSTPASQEHNQPIQEQSDPGHKQSSQSQHPTQYQGTAYATY